MDQTLNFSLYALLDLSSVFDTVDSNIIIHRLEQLQAAFKLIYQLDPSLFMLLSPLCTLMLVMEFHTLHLYMSPLGSKPQKHTHCYVDDTQL